MLMKLGFIGAYAVSYFQKSNECSAPSYSITKLELEVNVLVIKDLSIS